MNVDRNDEKRWSTNDIFDAWNALFPESDQHDVALLTTRLEDEGDHDRDDVVPTVGEAVDLAFGRLDGQFYNDVMELFPEHIDLVRATWLKVEEEWSELRFEVDAHANREAAGKEAADLIMAILLWARTTGIPIARHLDEKSLVVGSRPIERRGSTWHHIKMGGTDG